MMRRLLPVFLLFLAACTFPLRGENVPAPTQTPVPEASPTPTAVSSAVAPLGSKENPLILALSPSPRPSQEVLASGENLAAQLEKLTGFHVVLVAPASEKDLVQAFAARNVHIAVLSPFAYVLARQQGGARVALASVRNGEILYGAQFIARRDSGFQFYFDSIRGENVAEAKAALTQFNDKKPCWSDTASPSGYVIPLGVLNQAGVQPQAGAFVQGQATVVRAVYSKGICDFGATYTDARTLPVLEADYPDVLEVVKVVWRIPPIIPYENVSFATDLPVEIRRPLLRAFIDLMGNAEGKAAMQVIYGIDELRPAEDDIYETFATLARASGLNLSDLLK